MVIIPVFLSKILKNDYFPIYYSFGKFYKFKSLSKILYIKKAGYTKFSKRIDTNDIQEETAMVSDIVVDNISNHPHYSSIVLLVI